MISIVGIAVSDKSTSDGSFEKVSFLISFITVLLDSVHEKESCCSGCCTKIFTEQKDGSYTFWGASSDACMICEIKLKKKKRQPSHLILW